MMVNKVDHFQILLRFDTLTSVLKPRATGGTGCLKWQCSANCHLY